LGVSYCQSVFIPETNDLKYGPDGSLQIYVQNESPGLARESNWLPGPPVPFFLALRM